MKCVSKIPEHVLEELRESGLTDAALEKMEPREVFKRFCEWNGILGYSHSLYSTVIALEAANADS